MIKKYSLMVPILFMFVICFNVVHTTNQESYDNSNGTIYNYNSNNTNNSNNCNNINSNNSNKNMTEEFESVVDKDNDEFSNSKSKFNFKIAIWYIIPFIIAVLLILLSVTARI